MAVGPGSRLRRDDEWPCCAPRIGLALRLEPEFSRSAGEVAKVGRDHDEKREMQVTGMEWREIDVAR